MELKSVGEKEMVIQGVGERRAVEGGGKFDRRDGLPWKRVVLPTNSDRIYRYICVYIPTLDTYIIVLYGTYTRYSYEKSRNL